MGSITYTLRILEGKLKGHTIDLPENSELIVGRGATFDIVIDEDMVSRRHAKITTFHDRVMLHDLNSTNGTSVNQQKIQGAQRLQAGDHITIGTCVLELLTHAQAYQDQSMSSSYPGHVEAQPLNSNQNAYAFASTPVNHSNHMPPNSSHVTMSASLVPNNSMPGHATPPPANMNMSQTIPSNDYGYQNNHRAFNAGNVGGYSASNFNSMNNVRPRSKIETGNFPSNEYPDVFMLVEKLIERRHDGVLAVFDSDEREGNIYLRGGHIYFVTFEDPHRLTDHALHPIEGLMKVCAWRQGRFKIKNVSALPSFENEISEDSRSLLMQVRQHCKELEGLKANLPPLETVLYFPTPLQAPLSALNVEQLDTFQLCLNQMNIGTVIDYHPKGERDGIQTLLFLMEQGYLMMR